jgi:hypothetical protein
MTARWSFEALAVKQFKDNDFEKHFFVFKMNESQYSRYGILIDKLIENLNQCKKNKDNAYYREVIEDNFTKLNRYINELSEELNFAPGKWISSLNIEKFNSDVEKEARTFLDLLKKHSNILLKKAYLLTDSVSKSLVEVIGIDGKIDLQNNYENKRLKSLTLDEGNLKLTQETSKKIIEKYQPGYMKAKTKYGRSHFYAPIKLIGNMEIATYKFNMAVVWIVSFLLYMVLYFNLLKKLMDYIGSTRLLKAEI